jgi:hypothetical protein
MMTKGWDMDAGLFSRLKNSGALLPRNFRAVDPDLQSVHSCSAPFSKRDIHRQPFFFAVELTTNQNLRKTELCGKCTIDKQFLTERIGALSHVLMKEVEAGLRLALLL